MIGSRSIRRSQGVYVTTCPDGRTGTLRGSVTREFHSCVALHTPLSPSCTFPSLTWSFLKTFLPLEKASKFAFYSLSTMGEFIKDSVYSIRLFVPTYNRSNRCPTIFLAFLPSSIWTCRCGRSRNRHAGLVVITTRRWSNEVVGGKGVNMSLVHLWEESTQQELLTYGNGRKSSIVVQTKLRSREEEKGR